MAERGGGTLEAVFTAARSPDLSPAEFRLWSVVRSFQHPNGCYASTETLASATGLSPRTVERFRPELVRKGWLEVQHRGPKEPRLYAVLPSEAPPKTTEQGAKAPMHLAEQAPESSAKNDGASSEAPPPVAEQGRKLRQSSDVFGGQSTEEQHPTDGAGSADAPREARSGQVGEGARAGAASEPPEKPPDAAGRLTRWLVAEWVKRQPDPGPDAAERRRQGGKAKQLAAAHEEDRIRQAVAGIERLYPHSAGQPWDLFTLERKFSEAAAAANGRAPPGAERQKRERLRGPESEAVS